jgi:regulatory protein
MIVTEIIELDKKRNKIYIDNTFAFVLYKGECRIYGIVVGQEISRDVYDKIVLEVLQKRAKLRAMNLLTKKDFTEEGLRKKLSEGYYNREQIDETIEYLKKYGYIDDERYVRNYVSIHIQTKPRKKIVQKLIEKGISKELIENLLDEIYEEERTLTTMPDEMELGQRLLSKKKYDIENNAKDRQKAFGYLIRHGISSEVTLKLLKEY